MNFLPACLPAASPERLWSVSDRRDECGSQGGHYGVLDSRMWVLPTFMIPELAPSLDDCLPSKNVTWANKPTQRRIADSSRPQPIVLQLAVKVQQVAPRQTPHWHWFLVPNAATHCTCAWLASCWAPAAARAAAFSGVGSRSVALLIALLIALLMALLTDSTVALPFAGRCRRCRST